MIGSEVRSAVAIPLPGTAVLVTMRRGSRGPWTVVSDDASAPGDMAGPPPGDLILAGIAACTIVTIAGVASRRGPDLRGMTVSFEVKRRAERFAITQRTTIEGALSPDDLARFTRTAHHCPVGKLFTRRALAIEDQVELTSSPSAASQRVTAGSSTDAPRFLAGSVAAHWLPDTREWSESSGRRVLDEEGEARIQIAADRGDRVQRFGLLGGHSRAGWVPRPSSFATAGLAASTLMTLRARAASLDIDPATLRVEVRALSDVPAGGKAASQDRASEGEAPQVRWLRHVTVAGSAGASDAAIIAAMQADPIYGFAMRGDLLESDEVVARLEEAAAGAAS